MASIPIPRDHTRRLSKIEGELELNRWASDIDQRIIEILASLGQAVSRVNVLTNRSTPGTIGAHAPQHYPQTGFDKVLTAAHTGGYDTTATVGTSDNLHRADGRLAFPPAIMSSLSSSTLTLTDDGAGAQTLTTSGGAVTFTSSAGTGTAFRFNTTGTQPKMVVVVGDASLGQRTLLGPAWIVGGLTSETIRCWDAIPPAGGVLTTATIIGYDTTNFQIAPTATSNTANKAYCARMSGPLINNAIGGWTELAAVLCEAPRRSGFGVVVSTLSATIIAECPTVGTTEHIGLYIKQRTAQQTAANRYGIKIDSHNSGTNRYGAFISNKVECNASDFIAGTTTKGLITKDAQATPRFWRMHTDTTGTTSADALMAIDANGILSVTRGASAAGTVKMNLVDVGTAAPTS